MTKHKILTPALVVALSFLSIYSIVWAASTVGTDLTTTGVLTVTGVTTLSSNLIGTGASLSANFEVGGYASISGNLQFGGSGTHSIGVNSGSGALTINAFTLGGALTGNTQNITGLGLLTVTNASASNNFEVGGFASISGNLNFGGSGTHTLGTVAGSGALTINAFTLGGAITGGSNNITGIGNFSAVNASLSVNFEALGYASAAKVFGTTDVVAGSGTASSSSVYTGEFTSSGTTASTSILLAPSSSTTTKGTCIQLKDSTGAWVYARVVNGGTTFLVSTTKCHN